jgi:ferric-dicitrate binding protein FerR (iron transport regulator)
VQARNAESDSWTAAVINQTFSVGGEVQTLLDSKAKINLSEGSIVRLGPNTRFTLTELSGSDYDPITRLSLVAGELWVILNTALHSGSFDIETPVGVAAVRGSYLNVRYDQPTDSVIISCLEGLCELRNELGSIAVAAGQQASILKRGQLIDPPQPMSQEQLDRWANFVIEAAPLIEPMRQQLESWRATQAALDVTLQPGLLRTLVATLPAPPGGGLRP